MVKKPIFNLGAPSRHKYTQLLIVLVLDLVLSPFLSGDTFLGGNLGGLFSSALIAYAIILIVRTLSLNRKFFQIYAGFIVLVFFLEAATRLGWHHLGASMPFLFFVQTVYAIYLSVAAGLVLRDVWLHERVTADAIRGGICVYFLIGIVWALFYGIVASLDASAFSRSIFDGSSSYGDPIYFSFATLTTLGYGDIVPISPIAKALTSLEAIVGQMYPSILIARLVGGYVSQNLQ